MPTFNSYPALQAQTFDLPAIMEQAQRLKSARTRSKLQEFQLQQAQGEAGRREQFGGMVPGIMAGDREAIGQAAALDPGMTAKYLEVFGKMDTRQRAQTKAKLEQMSNMLMAVETLPPLQRPSAFAQARQQAQQMGMDVTNVPETYDSGWVRGKIAEAGQIKTLLDADPVHAKRMAAAKRDPSGGNKPAMLQVADAYKQAMKRAGKKVSDAQAIRWAKSSVNDTPQETWTKIYMANRRDITMDEDQARTIADEITDYVHGEGFGRAETPPPAGDGASLSPVAPAEAAVPPVRSPTEVTVPIPPEQGAPAPRRKPEREKAIETMTKDEVVALIYGGQELSQDQIDRLDARLEALGVSR